MDGDGMFGEDGCAAQHPVVDCTGARKGYGGEMHVATRYDTPSPSPLASSPPYN